MVKLILLLLFLFFPFEDWIISNLPFSGSVALIVKQLPDILLFLVYIYSIFRYNWVTNKLFLFFLAFVFYAVILCFATDSEILGFANLKALVRYIPLIFLLPKLNIRIDVLKNYFYYLVWFQLIVALIQFAFPTIGAFFRPAENIETELYSSTFSSLKNLNEISGTFGMTIAFCYFVILYYILFGMSRSLLITSLITVFLSGSKICFVVFALLVIYHTLNNYPKKLKKLYMLLGFLLIISSAFLYEPIINLITSAPDKNSFGEVFTEQYWIKILELQRGAVIRYLLLPLLATIQIIFGYGPSKENIIKNIEHVRTPVNLEYFAVISEDVYLLTFIVYFGLIGTFLFLMFFKNLYKRSINRDLTMSLIFIIIIFSCFNQIMEVKGFSFYFWLFISSNLMIYKNVNYRNIEVVHQ